MLCSKCGATLQVGDFPFCRGRQSDHGRGVSTVVGDECDIVQKNGTREPIHFKSKQARKRWMKANSYREYDTHHGDMGSDKSKHSRSWATYDAYTAENVRILMERAFHTPSQSAPPLNMHIRTTVKDLTAEEAKQYV